MVTVVNPDGTTIVVGPTNTATPAPATPAPANPQPATPAPANPQPATPAPANPQPATPAPATPAPANPQPATPAPAGNNTGQQGGVVIIHPNNPTPTAPVAGPTFVAQQTVDGGNHYFPNWVIWIIVFILLLLLAFGGYILYQSGKDAAPAPAPTPTVKVINTGGPKTAVDPKALELATEANTKADIILQERENEKKAEAEAKEKEKNKESSDCSNNLAQEVFL